MKLDGDKLLAYMYRQRLNLTSKGPSQGADQTQIKLMLLVIDDLIGRIESGNYTIESDK